MSGGLDLEALKERNGRPCEACGAPLLFVRGPRGRFIPLDASPARQVYRVQLDLAGEPIAEPVEAFFVSHFSTCPEPGRFSRRPPERAS